MARWLIKQAIIKHLRVESFVEQVTAVSRRWLYGAWSLLWSHAVFWTMHKPITQLQLSLHQSPERVWRFAPPYLAVEGGLRMLVSDPKRRAFAGMTHSPGRAHTVLFNVIPASSRGFLIHDLVCHFETDFQV